jgi:hypothetical protein
MSLEARVSFPVCMVATLLLGVASAAATRAAGPVPQKGGDKTVYAIAVDADNKLVTDLNKDEWAIREDGTDRAVVNLKPKTTDPLDMVLLIDTSKSAGASITDLRAGLQALANTLFTGPAPVSMSVMDVAGSAVMIAKDQKTADAVDKLLARTVQDQTQDTVVLEALNEAAKKLEKSSTPRRAIVVVNMDGVPEGSTLDSPTTIRSILASGASLWVVTYENNDTKSMSIQQGAGSAAPSTGQKQGGIGQGNIGGSRDVVLTRVPPGTGGLRARLSAPSALTDTLTTIGSAIVGQYSVTYTRPDGPMPKVVQMGDTRTGVKVIYPSTPIK